MSIGEKYELLPSYLSSPYVLLSDVLYIMLVALRIADKSALMIEVGKVPRSHAYDGRYSSST
jgi:hypothetical protein